VIASQADPKLAVTGVWVLPQKREKPPLWGSLARRVRGGGFTEEGCVFCAVLPVLAGNQTAFSPVLIPFENENVKCIL